jgi:hypothetical protein
MKTITKSILMTAILWSASISTSFSQSLSARSLSVKHAFEALKRDTASTAKQLAYIKVFPANKQQFLAVFPPEDFTQLYDGHEYIKKFADLVAHYPANVISKAINIGKDLEWDADAVNYLQDELVSMGKTHTRIFVKNIKALPTSQTNSLITFLADSENHASFPEYQLLIDKLKAMHQSILANKFIAARSKRQSIKHH